VAKLGWKVGLAPMGHFGRRGTGHSRIVRKAASQSDLLRGPLDIYSRWGW
jgi:hypothetical protein